MNGAFLVLGAIGFSLVQRHADAETPFTEEPANGAATATPAVAAPALSPPLDTAAVTPADLATMRQELARQAHELDAVKARESARAQEVAAVRASGYLQVDFVPYDQSSQNEVNYSTGTPLNHNRFTLRRGHFRLDAVRDSLSGVLEFDANTTNGAQVRPIDAEIALTWPQRPDPRWPTLVLSAGLMKIPFGFEVPELEVLRPFLERSTAARALFPGERDLGARLTCQYKFLDLTLALMNGHPLGDRVFPALAPSARKEIVGRIGATAEVVPGVVVDLGVSVDTGKGFHEGTPTTKDQLVWRDDNGDGIVQATEVQVISGSSSTASSQFDRFALGANVRVAVHIAPHAELAVRAEVVRSSNLDRGLEVADPVGAGHDLRELGWYVGVTQELTRWGLVGLRYDRYNPDQDAREGQAAAVVPRDRSYSTLALLTMLRAGTGRFSVEYDVNRNALGRSANGDPTNLKSDTLTVRAQVQF